MRFREGPLGDLKVPLTWTAAVALIVAAVIGVAFLLADRRETLQEQAYGVTRQTVDTVARPVSGAIAAPGRWTGLGLDYVRSYFFTAHENRRLKVELAEMRQWRDRALALQDQNDRFKSLLGLRTDPPIPMASARVVSDSRGPFANTRLADAGSERGIVVGNPVLNERGLVGRVVGVSRGVSRVLLLTDIASRTPVMIDRTNARAILTGDGGPNPKLDYLRGVDPIQQGDRVVTSGDGGVVPRGLPVGAAVKGLDGRWRVVLFADQASIDYVRILLFKDFAQLADEKQLQARSLPPVTTEDPQTSILSNPVSRPVAPTPSPATATPSAAPAARPATTATPPQTGAPR
ncbi:rod shape-determining protein MreC [Caulobacter vibrioides]|uniref:rod shape-determining protein MreC n=1 Tax=Caulobacter vibrioides TaxID=155892 RepID=UPI000BB46977|nr:rod shape-determining protein MreC [Caulobacter vibrioides]ATC24558.1 rod shape-determining protein MreC [Caulobacter vibrioides]AZH12700.1 rod shape-determining protein MreC [Caulobacter vibrioides]PLR10200.1 rod shape-determining protein MreC [Caulobacter vibrioides]